MPVYRYVGRTERGLLKRGTIESKSRNEAIRLLRERGIRPREVKETKTTIFNKNISFSSKRVKNQHFVVYCRQFAALIRAGIPIVEATNILAQQTESKALKNALFDVEKELQSGIAFSSAVEKHPKIFPPLFVNMVRAGEMTGSLDNTLERLATHYEKQYALKKKVQSTMTYPIMLLLMIIGVVIFLMVSIVPNFITMFEQFGSDLPAITQAVVNTSEFIQSYWLILLLAVFIIISIFTLLFKKNEAFHYGIHVALLKMPIFGKLLRLSAIARMTRTLSSLFSSSVPILQALGIVEKVVANPVIGKVVRESRESLEKGNPLSEPIKNSWVFPPLVSHMTAVGEQTGSLDFMLEKIADFYEEDVERTVDSLKSMIEPLMIVILAVVVGFIVLSIMIPMFTIYTEIG